MGEIEPDRTEELVALPGSSSLQVLGDARAWAAPTLPVPASADASQASWDAFARQLLSAAAASGYASAGVALGNTALALATSSGHRATKEQALASAQQWYTFAALDVDHVKQPTFEARLQDMLVALSTTGFPADAGMRPYFWGAPASAVEAATDKSTDFISAQQAALAAHSNARSTLKLPASVPMWALHPDALVNLAEMLVQGTAAIPGIQAEASAGGSLAARLMRAAACVGDHDALYWLGAACHGGFPSQGIAALPGQAAQCLHLAAGVGHAGAQLHLSRAWRTGDQACGCAQADVARADRLLQEAAASGHLEALYELGCALLENAVPSLPEERQGPGPALAKFELAGLAGHAQAAFNAGVMYYHGIGQAASAPATALQWYQRAGEAGLPEAWESAAALYATGEGVQQNIDMARHLTSVAKSMRGLSEPA